MFCPKCGSQMNENSRYCSKCGQPLKKEAVSGEEKIGQIDQKSILVIIGILVAMVILYCLIQSSQKNTSIVGTWHNEEKNMTMSFSETGNVRMSRVDDDYYDEGEYRIIDEETLVITYDATWYDEELFFTYELKRDTLTLDSDSFDIPLVFKRISSADEI